jgi:magnesium chelatase family protein
MAVKIHSVQTVGLTANIIDVEVDLAKGLHSFSLVGLPDKAVEESKDRISAAIKNTVKDENAIKGKGRYFTSPKEKNQKITIALAPADLKKEGPVFDLAIALAYLLASKQIRFETKEKLFLGELALDGSLRPIKGAIFLAQKAKKAGVKELFLPKANASEAALIKGIEVFGGESL